MDSTRPAKYFNQTISGEVIMKALLLVTMLVLAPFYAYAKKDVNVCATLANVISLNQDRFDQAEIALLDSAEICKNEANPQACVDEIKREDAAAKASLEKSQADYKAADCED